MKIESGLFSHMVLQRDGGNVSQAKVVGTCGAAGEVLATVATGDRGVLDAWTDRPVGAATDGRFEAQINGLPSGGPYSIGLSVSDDRLTVDDVLVGDVWMLAGQSNMEGMGLRSAAANPHPQVRACYMDESWALARDPIHNMNAAAAPCHALLAGGTNPTRAAFKGVGPGVGFGIEMLQRRGVPQGLIASAHGGTSMTQWQPDFEEGERCLYGAMLARFKRNGGAIAGMIWYQGESDANAEAADRYSERFQRMMACFRRDTDLPIPTAMVQIARVINRPVENLSYWDQIQEQQRRMAEQIAALATVPAVDLALDDNIHIAGTDQARLGRRLADCMQHLTGAADGNPPIALAGIDLGEDAYGRPLIRVHYDHVVGALRATGRPWGFHVNETPGQPRICNTRLDGAVVELALPPALTQPRTLSYGFGTNSYCNITDSADRSLPAFGPLVIHPPISGGT